MAEEAERMEKRQMRKMVLDVLREVSAEHGISVPDLTGKSRRREYSQPRQEAYYRVFVECPHISYPEMGRRMGGKDHTTCIHGVKAHCRRNDLSYENACLIRSKQREVNSVWIRSTVIPQSAQDYRRASTIYAQEIAA